MLLKAFERYDSNTLFVYTLIQPLLTGPAGLDRICSCLCGRQNFACDALPGNENYDPTFRRGKSGLDLFPSYFSQEREAGSKEPWWKGEAETREGLLCD